MNTPTSSENTTPTNSSTVSPDPEFFSAPLVHLTKTDPKTLSPTQLEAYIKRLREMRGSAQTRKAATDRKPSSVKKSSNFNELL
jgi:hypothetical protein